MGNRIVVSDVQESFNFVKYKRQENQLIIFADDTVPRWLTCGTMLDYNTMAGADKFGNVCIVSLTLQPDLLTTKRQWTYGPTLLPWNILFHTSVACYQLFFRKKDRSTA